MKENYPLIIGVIILAVIWVTIFAALMFQAVKAVKRSEEDTCDDCQSKSSCVLFGCGKRFNGITYE